MRESIGGAMMFYIVLLFFGIFTIFLAGITQYGRVFRTKNYIINYLEQAEGILDYEDMQTFDKKLKDYGYYRPYKVCRSILERGNIRSGNYYYVTLYTQFQIPILPDTNNLNKISIAIKGDTRLVETGNNLTESVASDVFTDEETTGIYCFTNEDGRKLN